MPAYDPENIFAKILRGEIPNATVADTDHTLAFDDITPQAPTHVLVIPKGAYVDYADFHAITNAGKDGVQEVPHFHLHLIGGRPLGRMLAKATD